jgi:hypothetical protein
MKICRCLFDEETVAGPLAALDEMIHDPLWKPPNVQYARPDVIPKNVGTPRSSRPCDLPCQCSAASRRPGLARKLPQNEPDDVRPPEASQKCHTSTAGVVAPAPSLGSSPESSSRSALSWRRSAARRSGSGFETKSAKAACNPSASVSGNLIRSSGTWAGRRIATGSPTKNLPRAVFLNAGTGSFVQPGAKAAFLTLMGSFECAGFGNIIFRAA